MCASFVCLLGCFSCFLVYVLVPCRELLDGPGFPADAVDLVHRAYFAVWGVESHINVHPLQLELGLELIP